ncbi:MAG: hypothetical protein WBA97_32370 [Actinophytocola sp.]|uniref:hypothetical protein n=1 Tax=Actinophytocola sp. TaxID=1872138 RepID=UPI003C725F74
MRRLACALVLLPVLVLGAGCRGEGAPGGSGVDQQVNDVESTLDAIESEMAGD